MEAALALSLTLPAGQQRQDFLRDVMAALAAAGGGAAPPPAPAAAEPEEEAAAPAAAAQPAPAVPRRVTSSNFANDEFRRMVRDGVLPNGLPLFINTKSGVYEAKMMVNHLAGGALDGHIVSAGRPEFWGWEGGKWSSPSRFSTAQCAHITPHHPRASDGANGWMVVRVGNPRGPTMDQIRRQWKENSAAAAARVAALMPA
jgi:hypothetical protein